jgi:peptidoglycan/xylan/chitin deacetylase (PgdA/CDA1 family)
MVLGGYPVRYSYDNTRPPVVPLVVSGIFQITHPTVIDAYALSALLLALSGVGCYLIARKLMNRWPAIVASFVFVTSPYVYHWAGIGLTNVEGAGVAGLGLALLAMAATGRPRLFVAALPLLVVAPFVRYTMGLVVPLAVMYLVLNRKAVRLRTRHFALGILAAIVVLMLLYSVWVSHLQTGGAGSLFPGPNVSNPADYTAYLAQIPAALGQGLYGYALLGCLIAELALFLGQTVLRKRPDPLATTLLVWAGLLIGYYSLLWPDKSPLSVTRYSTEFVMPLIIISFVAIDRALVGVARLGRLMVTPRLSLPWTKMGAALILLALFLAQVGSLQTTYTQSTTGVDVPQSLGMQQVASWITTNVDPSTHLLLCTEWTLCWWYLPQYAILASDTSQGVLSLAPEVSYVIYDTSQFGGEALNLSGVAPVWRSTSGSYIVYKVGNGTALSESYFSYSVQRGDTLLQLGLKFDIPWQDIAIANDIGAPYRLYPDQVLSIPRDNPTCLRAGITLPADDSHANATYGAPVYANETGVNPEKRVIIRFDDGYQDEWTNALPILAQYGYHAVFAVIDSHQTTQSICTPYESYQQAYYMNWPEIQWLAQSGNEISDHTWTHLDLNRMSYSELNTQIVYSKQVFAEHGIDLKTLTLPLGDGYGNQTVTSYILANGFDYIYTVTGVEGATRAIYPYSNANVTWHDVDIFDNESLPTFESIVNQAGPDNVVGLTFHSVGDDAVIDTYETNTPNFAADMAYLHQNGFDVILPWQLPGIGLTAGQ